MTRVTMHLINVMVLIDLAVNLYNIYVMRV